MRESRVIIIICIIAGLLLIIPVPIINSLNLNIDISTYSNIMMNLECAIITGFVTAICNYCVSKRRVINSIYNSYFDLYRTYYYTKKMKFLFHYNVINFFNKANEISPKINDNLEEYHGLFTKKDSTYRKLDSSIQLNGNYKKNEIAKSLFCWFNKKAFNKTVEPLINEVEIILKKIDEKRFNNDKKEMIKLANYFLDENDVSGKIAS